MVYAFKLLFFVLLVGGAARLVFRPVLAGLLTPEQYDRAWASLFVVTAVAFLSFHPGLFIVALAIAAFFASRYLGPGNEGKVYAFLLFLLPLPPLYTVLGGLEGLNYVMMVTHQRALTLVLLAVPAVGLMFRQRKRGEPSLRSIDIAMLLIQLWALLVAAPSTNLTGLIRAFASSFVDVMIPYYVITRTLRTPAQLRTAGAHLLLGCLLMASVACLETLMQRNLYAGLQWVYGLKWEYTVDLKRGAFLRIDSSAPQPIVLGFCMVFGMALWTWLRGSATNKKSGYLVYLVFAIALVSTWSRGPWVGAILLFGTFILQRWLSARSFAVGVVVALAAAVMLRAFGGDDAILAGLAAVFGGGENDLSTIVYRRDLFDATIALIKQSPWMGVPNFETALERFRQGEGIIDVVNTYLIIMINTGVVGLVLFLAPYLLVLVKLVNARGGERAASKRISGSFALIFIGLNVTMLFIVFTVSSIGAIPYLMALGITLPVAWLLQREETAAVEVQALEPLAQGGRATAFPERAGFLPR